MNIPDEEIVEQIRENHYLQYFIGQEGYRYENAFDSSMMVHFRKRITAEMLGEINERIHENLIKKLQTNLAEEELNKKEPINKGKLLVDATCMPADIQYPCDLSLLNEARGKTESIIDTVFKQLKGKEKKRKNIPDTSPKGISESIKETKKGRNV